MRQAEQNDAVTTAPTAEAVTTAAGTAIADARSRAEAAVAAVFKPAKKHIKASKSETKVIHTELNK